MRLKRLELFGFKSFADRTALDFHNSLTGIVGPNGCGKSNVVDAVRWVLGEQRPTSMRGGEMVDVIFKGSASRPGLSVAEVTLVLDNSADTLAGRGAEVSITRRVFQSGEGEYLLDGERVRLKDVRDMLYDTGLGSRGYAVLEQGRIDAVLSANPLDRRAIFEEAAGISRFRQRKKETDARLKRVVADMQRLDDVLRELGTRVRSLKIQAGKAERYVAARDAWKLERSRSLKHRLFDHRAALERLGGVIAALLARESELRGAREGGETDVEAREREQRALAAEVDRLGAELARLSGEGRALDERHAQLVSRIAGWRTSAGEESARAAELETQLEVRARELVDVHAQVASRQGTLAQARDRGEALGEALREARESHRALRERSEKQNQTVLQLLHEKTAAMNTARHLETARGPLVARSERARERWTETRTSAGVLRAAVELAGERLESARTSLAASEERRTELRERQAGLERALAELETERGALELERAKKQSHIAALRDLEREREGLDAGARALLAGVEGANAPCLPQDLCGLLADHLRTSSALARALDAALGERALGLVVRSPDFVSRIARWLKERRAGQVRLLVAKGDATPRAAAAPEFSGAERELVEGPLLGHVQCASGCERLAQFLVGDVWLARDLEAALALAGAHPELRFVTREGDLVDAAGFVGGHREIAQGAVGRRSSAEDLERELELSSVSLARCGEALERQGAERSRIAGECAQLDLECETVRCALEEARSEGHTARARLCDLEEALALAEREHASVTAELETLERDRAGAQQSLTAHERDFARENAALSELEKERHAQEQRRDGLQREEQAFQVELARLRAEHGGLEQRARDLERAAGEARCELERTRKLAAELAANAEGGAVELVRLREQADRLLEERGGVEVRLGELRATERAGRDAIEGFRRRVDAVTHELEALLGELSQKRLEEQRLALERGELLARAQEELDLNETALLDGFAPEAVLQGEAALAGLEARVAELKRELDRLGPVNTEAVVELAQTEGRFTFLDTQRKDLLRSRQGLEETLRAINDESVRLFLETFEEVRAHFQVLFRQLFGGGRADLELEAGVDPLEGGIEITARPPGREMLPIGLLSGGQRTMTALALLFAVFKARPSPFCVLDEVDAALDDANVGRFLAMLDHFRTETQFIVVTHNKGTMAACEGLYGITMETKGVSRHVAVEFGDVERIDPLATGDAGAATRSREETRSRDPARPTSETGRAAEESGPGAAEEREPDASAGERTVELRPARRISASKRLAAERVAEGSEAAPAQASPLQEADLPVNVLPART
jgi:chromosome segregation protein